MKKFLFVVALLSLALCVRAEDKPKASEAAAPKKVQHKPDDVVARAGKIEVKWKEVSEQSDAFAKQLAQRGRPLPAEAMDQLHHDITNEIITRQLLLQEAAGSEPADLDAKVKVQLEQAKLQAGGADEFATALKEMSLTQDDFAKRVREGLIIQGFLQKTTESKVKVSGDDCKKFYDDNRAEFSTPEQVRASHILIRIPSDATAEVRTQKLTQIKAALALVKGGEKFETVAQKVSEDPGSAQQGGDLSYFPRGRMVPEFETVAFALKTNEVSDVVTSQFGYHIIKSTGRRAAGERTFDEVKEDIERYLKGTQSRQFVQQHLKDLRDKNKVEILLPQPPPMPMMGGLPVPPNGGPSPK